MTWLKTEWLKDLKLKPCVTLSQILQVEDLLGIDFPLQYKEFMMFSNGASGPIGNESYIIFFSLEEVLNINLLFNVKTIAPNFVIFASDGGGEFFLFDVNTPKYRVAMVPIVVFNIKEAIYYADTFSGFWDVLYKGLWNVLPQKE